MKPRFLAFRPKERVVESLEQAEEADVSLKVIPLVATKRHPGAPIQGLLTALAHGHVDFAVFSSPTAFQYLQSRAGRSQEEVRALLTRPRVVAIGERTAQELRDFTLRPETPKEYSSEGLVEYLAAQGVEGKGVILLRSSRGSRELVHRLREMGARIRDVPLYDLEPVADAEARRELQHAVLGGKFHGYAFTSSLTVEAFFRIFEAEGHTAPAQNELRAKAVGAIGAPTRQALEAWGIEAVVPSKASFRELLATLRAAAADKGL